jgi:Cu(I)/Ag(I) efflux system membrane protein CusA/SilA
VLLNVQGRDVGGFVEDARATLASKLSLPPGYFVGWSGRWENQARARGRLQVVLPIVLAIIFILLYLAYGSAVEAAHVLLAVPFALTGGIYLLWLLGYNFSVAVWVGFIALFGTAVQTAVVMVIFLEEAVQRKRHELGDAFTYSALQEAVMEGALLRLRPKVMTVATVVAGLLPIMWSQRVGAEVMKPLATPVLGGMVSSLAHVLIVTPVIFLAIQRRRLGLSLPQSTGGQQRPSPKVIGAAALAVIGIAIAVWVGTRGPQGGPTSTSETGTVVQIVRSGELEIAIRSQSGTLRTGRNAFVIEFRSASGDLVDVGTVTASANMAMPGMVMPGNLQLAPTSVPGRYAATAEFGMAGAWPMRIEWNGPRGRGSVNFEGAVQ